MINLFLIYLGLNPKLHIPLELQIKRYSLAFLYKQTGYLYIHQSTPRVSFRSNKQVECVSFLINCIKRKYLSINIKKKLVMILSRPM